MDRMCRCPRSHRGPSFNRGPTVPCSLRLNARTEQAEYEDRVEMQATLSNYELENVGSLLILAYSLRSHLIDKNSKYDITLWHLLSRSSSLHRRKQRNQYPLASHRTWIMARELGPAQRPGEGQQKLMQAVFRVPLTSPAKDTKHHSASDKAKFHTRRSHKKSRTGCQACKRRRVKVSLLLFLLPARPRRV
jgi:hypothetical protein